MNMIQPMGPRNSTITSQPMRGLNGQRDPAGMRQGPADGLSATCSRGSRKPTIMIVQAAQTGSNASPDTAEPAENRVCLTDYLLNQN